jgi:hypothetical protein
MHHRVVTRGQLAMGRQTEPSMGSGHMTVRLDRQEAVRAVGADQPVMYGFSQHGDGRYGQHGGDGPFYDRGLQHEITPWQYGPRATLLGVKVLSDRRGAGDE